MVLISAFVLVCLSFSGLGAGFALGPVAGFSDANVAGPIVANTTWTLAGSPYVVSADVLVIVDVSLTIEPGVVVRFANGTSIIVDGSLVARGNPSQMITFTSNASSPAPGDWGGIRTRTGGHIDEIDWVTIEYSSGGIQGSADSFNVSQCFFHQNNVGVSGSNVKLTYCTFEENVCGVDVTNLVITDSRFFGNANGIIGSGTVRNSNVWNNSAGGIIILGSVTDCSIYGNGGSGVSADSVTDCSAYDNVGYGISANSVINCLAFNNSGDGIIPNPKSTLPSSSVINCSVYDNEGNGIGGSGVVINCSISGNGSNGVVANQIFNSVIFDNKGVGTSLGSSGVVLSGCSIYSNLAGGVEIFPDREVGIPTASLEQTTIRDNLFGVLISCIPRGPNPNPRGQGRYVTISNCSITHNLQNGIMTDESGGVEIDLSLRVLNTTVDSNGKFGISLNTTVINPEDGVVYKAVYFPINEVSGCTISNNEVGALGHFGSVKGSNIINNSEIGLDVFSASGGINGNNIYRNGIYNIRNNILFGQDVNASQNWWGTTNRTLIEAYIYDYYEDYNLSRVVVEPFLTSPIPEFPLAPAAPSGFPIEPIYLYILTALAIIITVGAVAFIVRRKKKPPEEAKSPQI